MRGFILDTNVVAELRRLRPEPNVLTFLKTQPQDRLHVSQVTLAETRFGIGKLDDANKRVDLEVWLDQTVRPFFGERVHAIDEETILRWRMMVEDGKRRRHNFAPLDLFIAATAAIERLIVVTRDETHFVAAQVPVLNPWKERFRGVDGAITPIADLGDPALLEMLPT